MALLPSSSYTPQAKFNKSGKVKQTIYNVRDYGAVADIETVADGAITAGGTTLTSASNPFVSHDVGKSISIANAKYRSIVAFGNINSGSANLNFGLTSKGNWKANINSPTIADGVGTLGDYYVVSIPGTQNLGSGSQTFIFGNYVVYNGSIWQQRSSAQDLLFQPQDQGKPIKIVGAGVAGADLLTTILTYTDNNSVVLATTASTTVTDAVVTYGATGLGTTIAGYTSAGQITVGASPTWTVSSDKVVWGTDDTDAFQDAFDAATASNGGIVFASPGNYLFNSSAVTVSNNTTLSGAGKGATNLVAGASFNDVAMIYHLETSSSGDFHAFCMEDLTINGSTLSSVVRGLQIDTSAFNTILYYDLLIQNVSFENCYIGVYHAANNTSAGSQQNGLSFSYCSFIGNSYGHMVNGSYGEWLDHCFFVDNKISAGQTKSTTFGITPSGGAFPGGVPDTIMKITNCDIENTDGFFDFTTGFDNGFQYSASHSSFHNIFISGISQCPFVYVNTEPKLQTTMSNIRLRYCGAGMVLGQPGGSPGTNIKTGAFMTNIIIWRCGLKSNWSTSKQRQSLLFILGGSWTISSGYFSIYTANGDTPPDYAIQLGTSGGLLGNIEFNDIWIPADSWALGVYNITGQKSTMNLQFNNCFEVDENIVADSALVDIVQATSLLLPDSSVAAYSISSDGTANNNVSIPNSASLQMTHTMTFSAWVNITALGLADYVAMTRADSGANTCYIDINSAGTVEFGIHDSTGWSHPSSSQVLNTGVWYHVAMTYANGVAQIGYIDGNVAAYVDMTGRDTLAGSTKPVYIGSQYDGTLAFDGLIDDVRIYNVALTQDQIQQIYLGVVPTSGLVGQWLFSEGSGTTANDTSGNSNTGTIHGTMAYSSTTPTNTVFYPKVPVSDGGSGLSSLTAYSLLAGGTTTSSAMQQISGVGTSGQILTSNGASALPTWQPATTVGSVKDSVVATTTGSETYTILTGNVTVIAGTTLDGQSPSVGDRILVKDAPASTGTGSVSSTQPGNGIYTITTNVTNLVISRSSDMSGSNSPQGAFTFVEGGTVNSSSGWIVSVPSTDGSFTYGTNNIKWTQFSGAGEITAGTGLNKSGNTLSIENSGVLLPAHGGTGVANSKNLTVSNTLTLAGTDSTVMTFPSTSATIARTDAAQTFTGTQTFALEVQTPQAITVSSNAGTADVNHGIQNFTNSSAASMTITLTTTSAVDGQLKEVRIYDFSAVVQSITWVNTENSNVTAPASSNGSTTLPVSVLFQFNSGTSLWRCIASA